MNFTVYSSRSAKVALLFGAAGCISAVAFRLVALLGWVPSFDPSVIVSSVPVFLLWGGFLLCVCVGACLVLGRWRGWIGCYPSATRLFAAGALVLVSNFVALYAGVFGALIASSIFSNGPSSGRHLTLAAISGMTFGILAEAAMISVALYVITGELNHVAWRGMLVAVVALDGLAIVFYPEIFFLPNAASAKLAPFNSVFTQSILSLHVWGSTAFYACAGYWLAASSCSTSQQTSASRVRQTEIDGHA